MLNALVNAVIFLFAAAACGDRQRQNDCGPQFVI